MLLYTIRHRAPIILGLALSCLAIAHDIPADVTVHAYLKPTGQTLNLLVRVPLKSMRDVDFPFRGPGFLDLARVQPLLPDAATLWIADFIELDENDTRLPRPRVIATRISLESDKSFASYDEAAAHLNSPPLAAGTDVSWNQTLLDVWFAYPIQSEQSRFSIRPALARLGLKVTTVLRFLPSGGALRALEFTGDPGLIRLDPRWHQAALRFVHLGFLHILDGADHLLFLLCLVIPFRRLLPLVKVVTAFTVAHSITLIAAAYDLGPDALWFPPLIETLIAASIVYMALENIIGNTAIGRRWMIAFGFGLIHGFGFSFALRETLQFAGSHLLTSLLAFNLGVELGQILMLSLFIAALEILFRFAVRERIGTIILSAIVAHTGWHWMTDRADRLRQYRFTLPDVSTTLRAAGAIILFALIALLLRSAIGARPASNADPESQS